jgi:hypothetical protein
MHGHHHGQGWRRGGRDGCHGHGEHGCHGPAHARSR